MKAYHRAALLRKKVVEKFLLRRKQFFVHFEKINSTANQVMVSSNRPIKYQNAILEILRGRYAAIFYVGIKLTKLGQGASFKPLITKIGDRPVVPYPC